MLLTIVSNHGDEIIHDSGVVKMSDNEDVVTRLLLYHFYRFL